MSQVLLFLIKTTLVLKLLEFQVFEVLALDIQQVSVLWRKWNENEACQSGCSLPYLKKQSKVFIPIWMSGYNTVWGWSKVTEVSPAVAVRGNGGGMVHRAVFTSSTVVAFFYVCKLFPLDLLGGFEWTVKHKKISRNN